MHVAVFSSLMNHSYHHHQYQHQPITHANEHHKRMIPLNHEPLPHQQTIGHALPQLMMPVTMTTMIAMMTSLVLLLWVSDRMMNYSLHHVTPFASPLPLLEQNPTFQPENPCGL